MMSKKIMLEKKYNKIKLEVDEQDFGTICVCALRYAMGRQTYMPSLVRDFVRPLLPKICDKSLNVMIQDCDFQERMNCYGDEKIDKPAWVKWKEELLNEYECRQNQTHDR